jgi:hypothetical protein
MHQFNLPLGLANFILPILPQFWFLCKQFVTIMASDEVGVIFLAITEQFTGAS